MTDPSTPLVDVAAAAFTAWLGEHVPELAPPLRASTIVGGRSNLTVRIDGESGPPIVLRCPPLAASTAHAHDVLRECRIYAAVRQTPVPVPPIFGASEDTSVLGVPFFVMGFVDGVVLNDVGAADRYPHAAKAPLADHAVDTLAALHAVPPAGIGLGTLGPSAGYLERQLRRWTKQYRSTAYAELAILDEVGTRLASDPPPQRWTGIVHGDYRLGNLIATEAGAVAAVLDWELTALGDTLADLGWLIASWRDPGEPATTALHASASAGFPSRTELITRYAAATEHDLSELPYYVAFAHWRWACVSTGVADRMRRSGRRADSPEVVARETHLRLAAEEALNILESARL